MPDCRYCGAEHDDEAAHLRHLRSAHADELSRIDRRRVAELDDGADAGGGPPTPLLVGGVAAVAVVGLVVWISFFAGGAGPDGTAADADVGAAGSAHYHGTIEMVVLGERVDFSREEYQLQADRFHFEAGDGERWHAHATGVTLAFGMGTLGIGLTADSVTFEGTTYVDGEGYAVMVTVDGDPVDPESYVLEDGDRVRIVVEAA